MALVAEMRVLVATIGKPFGVQGQVTIRLRTDEPATRIVAGGRVFTGESGSGSLAIENVRLESPGGVIGFAGIADRSQAEELRGRDLWSEVDPDRVPADPDEWYDYQLIDLPCYSPEGGLLGTVVAVEHHPAHDSLVVRTAADDRFVPFVVEIVTEVGQDGLVIDDPGGLLSDHDPGSS
jgi:16S rRNA processing protein RimM